jgi:hypothetical protein
LERFKKGYPGPDRSAGASYGSGGGSSSGSYGVDTNWYSDSGSTDHATSELEKLHVRDRYNGNEQIHTASGTGIDKHKVGHSVFHTPSHDLHLKNILHVPKASKSLLSTSRLTKDNHAFVEYWPNSFFVKDQDTREILLQGRCVDGLYPFPKASSSSLPGRQAHGVVKSSSSLWHRRLVHQVLRDNIFSLVSQIKSLFVMLVKRPRAINCPIQSHLVRLLFLLKVCFLMFGVLLQPQLEDINTRLVLLMIIASSLGSIS